jgi:hypothetical protein
MKMKLLEIIIVTDSPNLRNALFDILKNHLVSGISPVKVFISRHKHLAMAYPELEFIVIDATKAANRKNLISITENLFYLFTHLNAIILLNNAPDRISSMIKDRRVSVISPREIDRLLLSVIKSHC